LFGAVSRGFVALRNAVPVLLPHGPAAGNAAGHPGLGPWDWLPALLGPPPADLPLGDQQTLQGFQRLLPFEAVWARVGFLLQVCCWPLRFQTPNEIQ
jgi:hypothetical protein